ncbi:hypothetical protein M9H77_29426 [Catharanthus roseus]|uniref:Uncharacterized protein n=1 Tax=Catharanthus roseus TaxID=4058 RepID=A0ACB9ZUQ5_CATRO|nr:hypothetical protein M9H77_29426 [Catharanthus roseus]
MVEESGTVDNPPETAVTKGRRKMNSTKTDKSHWEYVSITHRKLGKSSSSGSGLGSCSGSGSSPSPRGREHVTELIRKTNWEEGSAPADYWMDISDHLYVIANKFNLCVVFLARLGSTTVLPLVSNMDGNAGTIFIGFIEEQEHFIHSLGWHRGSYRYVKATGNIPGILYPQVTAGEVTLVHDSVNKCKVPRATVPPQKYSSTRTSCCLSAYVPPEAG